MNLQAEFQEIYTNKQEKKRDVKEVIQEATDTNRFTTDEYLPSIYYPIRTATFWADTLMGSEPVIKFFINNELHKNGAKAWGKVIDMSALHQVLRETEYELSLRGESDIALFKQGNNIVPLKIRLIHKQYYPNGALKYYHGITNLDTGTLPWIITKKFYYNDEGDLIVENAPLFENEDGEWEDISVEKFNKKYKQELKYKINLGKIEFPVFTFTNKGADRWGSGKSDTAGVKDILRKLDIIDNAVDADMFASKTRLIKPKRHGALGGLGGTTESSIINQLKTDVDVLEYEHDPTIENGQIQVSERKFDSTAWETMRRTFINQYCTYTGENVETDAHGNNQHTFEIMSKGDNKFRVGMSKKGQRIKDIKNMVSGIISFAKLHTTIGGKGFAGITDISIDINETDIRKEFEKEDKVEKLLSLGLISKIQAIQKIYGEISYEDAKAMYLQKIEDDKIEPKKPQPIIQQPQPQVDNTNVEDTQVDNTQEEE